jgi:hypothetical protein
MKKLLPLLFLLLFSCIKEDVRNWYCIKENYIYRSKCGVDYFTVDWTAKAKTNDEIVVIQNDSTYSRYATKREIEWLYQGKYELPDSVWIESSCNCDPMYCQ